MTSDELNALRRWAEVAAPVVGVSQVRQVLALLDDHARLTALVQSLAEQFDQACRLVNTDHDTITGMMDEISELKEFIRDLMTSQPVDSGVCNCGAGTSFGPMAGHWGHCKINTTNEEKQIS